MISRLRVGYSGGVRTVDGKDHRPFSNAAQDDLSLTGLSRHLALAMYQLLGNLEVLALVDLDLLLATRAELESYLPLRT